MDHPESRIVARGVWLYDGKVSRPVEIHARPANFSGSRFDDVDRLDETRPIPDTPDALVYYIGATTGGEFYALAEANKWAEAQPWGPVKWE